jgi:hypothetical protein
MSPFDAVPRRSVRAAAVSPPFPLGEVLPSPVSAEERPRRSTASSVLLPRPNPHPRLIVRLAFMSRTGLPCRSRMRPPRFRAKNFSTCTRSTTARGSPIQASTLWDDVAFSAPERDQHLGIRPVSQLNTWPVVSPVNASRRPSRDAAHHSGLGWLARPFPWGTLTSYSLPAFLAHTGGGQTDMRLLPRPSWAMSAASRSKPSNQTVEVIFEPALSAFAAGVSADPIRIRRAPK